MITTDKLGWIVAVVIFVVALFGTHQPPETKKCVNGFCMPADLDKAIKPAPKAPKPVKDSPTQM